MMRMDEIMEEFSGSSSDQIVVKRKRTKRPRPSSSPSSSSGGYAEFYINSLQVSSPATTSSTEEDEDMANCLILLARGMSTPPQPEEVIKAVTAENKFSSRKFTEMATSTNDGRVGIYVYECKTCNRTFPSFQALGGHRASHKKPKTATDNDQKKSPPDTAAPVVDQQEEERKLTKIMNTVISPPPSTQSQNKSCNIDPNKPKIHECSICGAEFASGQALGGHMRRHRPAPKIGTSTDSDTTSSHEAGDKKPKNVFSLDLNLPAPQEDEKFGHQQQPHLVFSAAALVDCHY